MKNIIRIERARKRITQAELADAVGATKMTILNIENEVSEPRLGLAMRIAKFFGKPVDEIFEEN